uniref:Filamin binding LIM protein 1 n=1 Tax=Rousettus aegyptiacus TaxID=9407 RepID=A0A7J8K897_ROUAE|nr:filamin binding LIM protein 1 [Rousettus aegyptiacus]
MASKPEKRVASSVFITLAPPRRHEAVAEEVRRAACEARPGRSREPSAPTKAAGAGSAGRPGLWTAPGRAAAPVPPQLSNGGCSLPPPALDGEDALPDLDLLSEFCLLPSPGRWKSSCVRSHPGCALRALSLWPLLSTGRDPISRSESGRVSRRHPVSLAMTLSLSRMRC